MLTIEKHASELRRLRAELDQWKKTSRIFEDGLSEASKEVLALNTDLEIKQYLLDEAIRKGLQLCEQNGDLLMQLAAAKADNDELSKIVDDAIAFHEGDDSPHAQLEQENARLKAELAEARKVMGWIATHDAWQFDATGACKDYLAAHPEPK